MGLFRKAPTPYQTTVAMIGAQAGDRVLFAGRPEPVVVAELARITGLTGQTLIAVEAAAQPAYDAAAANAGILVESVEAPAGSARLPDTGGGHDVVVLHFDLAMLDQSSREAAVADALAALRPGGRVVMIEGRHRQGWFGSRPEVVGGDVILALLTGAGALGARSLGAADDVAYFEARKSR